ncbi:MAG: AMP-binding protein [bacterium]|nr:AMP-binding protein [bacterium]
MPNLAAIHEAIAEAIPDRECLVFRDRRFTWAQTAERSRRLANHLAGEGLGSCRDRSGLCDWQSGQDHVALYLHNGNEYLEGMIGAFKSRTVPVNLNYRFVDHELVQILRDSNAVALIFHSRFAERVEKIAAELPRLQGLLQVEDESGAPLVSGARWYEEALTSSSAERSVQDCSPDDLYLTYTGGTTGAPKAVLWRQADIFLANMNGRREDGLPFESMDEIVERAKSSLIRVLPQAPFMHVAGHAAALGMWNAGGTVIIPEIPERFDAPSILECMQRERVNMTVLVGDAMARPCIEALRTHSFDLGALQMIVSGGAALSDRAKRQLLERLPHVAVVEGVGSSETGGQASNISTAAEGVAAGGFALGLGTTLLNAQKSAPLDPGDPEPGWLARSGPIPLGYLGDAKKTAETFLEIDDIRYVVPGDRARWRGVGELEFLGRDSAKINSGGEKVFAEEVEAILMSFPSVNDVAVVGRPNERLGEEVVAVVALESGEAASERQLIEACAGRMAGFKTPRTILFRDEIRRGPAGKVDLAWIREQVDGGKQE